MLDFSFLFDDEEQGDDRVVPPPKKSKKDGFIMTLDEAIEAEIRAIKTAKSPCIVTVREVSEHVDLIKKFIGDYSRFESYNEREIDQVEEFFRERIRKCYSFHSDEHREFELSEEEMSWINMNYDTVVRIFYRTQAPVLHESQVWFGKSFLDISVELANLAKHEAFLKRVSLILSVPEDRAENMNSATSYDRDEIMALLREKGSAYGLTPKQVNENMNGFEDHLCKFVNAVNFEENGPIHDDREQFNAPNVALPLNNYPIKLDEDDGPVFEAPAPESNHEEGHLKSILKKTPGNHYSDRNVAKMSVEERVAYSKNYDLLGSKKKTVSFSDAPECLVVFCKHSKSFIDAHKKKNGTGRAVWYPRQTTCFHVGERATTAIEISYEQYRVMTWEVENPLGVQRPATSFTNISNRDCRVRCFKDGIYKADDQDENGLEVPVHRYLVYPFAVPFIDQNALLEDHYSNLIKYSLFSQPSKSSVTCSYNHSYGPMIITDSILEDANPYAVSNSGIFPFPYPLDELAVLGMLDELTPDQFFIRDIVFIWGFDKLMQNERSEDAVADLLTLYEMVKVKMLSKFEEYKRQGFSRLFKPRFWLSTFPETAALNMENFNDYIRAFVSHSSAIEETSSIPCRVDLIDWDQVCKEHQCPVSCKTAEDQLELLYKELEKKVDLVRRRDNAAKRLDIEKQLTRTNAMEWLANRIQKDRV